MSSGSEKYRREAPKKCSGSKQHQVALVGIQRVGARVRGEDDAAVFENCPDFAVDRGIEREIGQPVVDQVDRLAGVAQVLAVAGQFGRIDNDGGDAVGLEHFPEQRELGGQELPGRVLVDDGDAA